MNNQAEKTPTPAERGLPELPERVLDLLAKHGGWAATLDYIADLERQSALSARPIPSNWVAVPPEMLRRTVPFLRDEAANYDDDGSNEPLELVREIEAVLAGNPNREAANPGGCECEKCGRVFIGAEWHVLCGICIDHGVAQPDGSGLRQGNNASANASETSPQPQVTNPAYTACNVEGTWLWGKLMDWCRARGTSPANFDSLFAIAREAHKLYASPQPAAEGIVPVKFEVRSRYWDGAPWGEWHSYETAEEREAALRPYVNSEWQHEKRELFAAPVTPNHPQPSASVAWSVLRIGRYGAAYDAPNTKRAYTYDYQPDNVDASRLGEALKAAANASYGDNIDRGLSLLKALQGIGFGVFQVGEASALTTAAGGGGEVGNG